MIFFTSLESKDQCEFKFQLSFFFLRLVRLPARLPLRHPI